MNIVLTGFMASGKTEISKTIARLSGRHMIDTDEMVVEHEGISINDIFAKYGEEYFRKAEHEVVVKASAEDNAVIATGGGAVLNKTNLNILRKNGIIFNLSPDFEIIEERLAEAAATRPLLRNQDIKAIRKRFNDRLPFYEDCDYKVHITRGKTPVECAKEILNITEYCVKTKRNSLRTGKFEIPAEKHTL